MSDNDTTNDRLDGGIERSEHSMECYDCERRFRRSDIEMHEVPMEFEDRSGYRFVPVPICHECALRRFGIKCDHCGEYHLDIEAVAECKRDRPGLIPDGGIERHTGDHVREALNRHYFNEKTAWGEIGGTEILLVASLSKWENPKLIVHAGGEFVEYPEKDIESEFAGGSTYVHSFDQIHSLDREFDRLCGEYDLEEVEADGE